MSTQPSDIYSHATALPHTSEAEIRAKISRLYYALYSYACEFESKLPAQGTPLKRGSGMHSQLTQRLTNPSVQDDELKFRSRLIGTKQMLAHEIRVRADYHLDQNILVHEMKKCERFVIEGMAIPLDPPPASTAKPTLTRIQ